MMVDAVSYSEKDVLREIPQETEGIQEELRKDESNGAAGTKRTYFMPAAHPTFHKRCGEIKDIDMQDFEDPGRQRHLASFQKTMEEWMNYGSHIFSDIEHDVKLQNFAEDFFRHRLVSENIVDSQEELEKAYKLLRKKHGTAPSKDRLARAFQCLKATRFQDDETFVVGDFQSRYLTKKWVRSTSGVNVITVLTSPGRFSCPKDCHYCPNEPGQPRSYLSTEPAVLRGNQCGWDAARQFWDRGITLDSNGHAVDKIELLVLGGTWSGYPPDYQVDFIRDIFYAANTFRDFLRLSDEAFLRGDIHSKRPTPSHAKSGGGTETTFRAAVDAAVEKIAMIPRGMRERLSLLEEQKLNEASACRIIGLTLETRPDFITQKECYRLRMLGCTRVQIGIQHTNDAILKYINRDCTRKQAIDAIRILKDNCFKVDIHLMPDLPSSDVVKDEVMFNDVLGSSGLQADQWKIYPCEVTPYSLIEQWYKDGKFMPYSEHHHDWLIKLLIRVKTCCHPWIRLNRVIRDIPNQSIIAGNSCTNLRQILGLACAESGYRCRCMRCREVGSVQVNDGKGRTSLAEKTKQLSAPCLKIRKYPSDGGTEYFLSYETADEATLFGFLRLRIPDSSVLDNFSSQSASAVKRHVDKFTSRFECLQDRQCGLIRELHVYGLMIPVGDDRLQATQHAGLGTKLMAASEAISLFHGMRRTVIIAGIGVREYYKRMGYVERETFMVKDISTAISVDSLKTNFLKAFGHHMNKTVFELQEYNLQSFAKVESVQVPDDVIQRAMQRAEGTKVKPLISAAPNSVKKIDIYRSIIDRNEAITNLTLDLSQAFSPFSVLKRCL